MEVSTGSTSCSDSICCFSFFRRSRNYVKIFVCTLSVMRGKGLSMRDVSVSLSLSFSTLFILQTSLGLCSLALRNETETGFTFSHPGKSYVEYRHAWARDRGYAWMISLRFRTTKSSAFLFHHFHLESLPSGLRPQVWVRIKKGDLQVSYTDGGPMQTMVLGRGKQCHAMFGIFIAHIIYFLLRVFSSDDVDDKWRSLVVDREREGNETEANR